MIKRRSAIAGALGVAGLAALPLRAQQDITFFRILTGGTVGTYFPIGGLASLQRRWIVRRARTGRHVGGFQWLSRQRRRNRGRLGAVRLRAVGCRLLGVHGDGRL